MNPGLIQTKIRPPRIGRDVLPRPRLLTWLENDLPEHQLGLVIAQAGSGKTTLLADFARQSDLPVCWFALDSLDNDLYRFCTYFVGALTVQFPDFGADTTAFLQHTADLPHHLDTFVTYLINDIVANIQEHFVLVLDDYHLVSDNDPINRFLSQYLTHASENSHIVLLARGLPHLPVMAELILADQTVGFDFDNLAFTAEEIRAFWSQTNFTLTDEQVQSLVQRTKGWITGVKLAEMGDTTTTPPAFLGVRLPAPEQEQKLDHYFEQKVWRAQSPALQEVLLRTAVPDTFDVPLCTAVFDAPPSDQQTWSDLLTELAERNLFLMRVGANGEALRYQDLFRDYLRRKVERERPTDTAVWRRNLADYYSDQQEWTKAFDLYQQLRLPEALAAALQRAWHTLAPRGQYATLAHWLGQLPTQLLLDQPDLLARLGLARANSQQKKNTTELDEAVTRLRQRDDAAALGRALAWRALHYEHQGRLAEALADTAEAIQLADTDPAFQQAFWLAEALRVQGVVLWRQGELDRAKTTLLRARQQFAHVQEYQTRGLALTAATLGKVYRLLGDYEAARTCYQEAYEVWEQLGNRNALADVANSLGVLYHSWGDFLEAERWLEETWSLARASQQLRMEVYALVGLGDLYADLGALAAAERVWAQAFADRTAVDDQYLLDYVHLRLAEMARWRQDWTTNAEFLAAASGATAFENAQTLQREKLLRRWTQEQDKEIVGALTAVAQAARSPESRAVHWLWVVQVAQAVGDEAQVRVGLTALLTAVQGASSAVSVLATAVRLGETWLTSLAPYTADLPGLASFVTRVQAFRATMMQVRRQLRQKTLTVPLGPPQLTIHTLGRYELWLGDQPVTSVNWLNQTRTRKLLALLLVAQAGLTKEEIGLILWPDDAPTKLTGKLGNAKYKLGLAVGSDVLLYDSKTGRYRFNWDWDYVYDVAQVRHYARLGRQHGREADWRQVLAWYGGAFLPEFDEDIFVNERPLLEALYREALGNTAVAAEQRGDETQAEQDWLALLALDPYEPLPIERLMYLYRRTRQPRKLLDCYERHVAAMAELGLPPDEALERLKKQLLGR